MTGDWRGAAMTAFAVIGSAAVLALALVALANPEGLDLKEFLTVSGLLMASAFGGDVATGFGGTDFDVAVSVGAYPLTLTIAALGVGSFVFWRRVSRLNHGLVDALAHAARASVILGILLAISSMVTRTSLRLPDELSFIGMPNVQGTLGTHAVSTGALAAFYLFLTCTATCLRRGDWLPARLRNVRDLLVLPVVGLGAVLAVACVAALVAATVAVITTEVLRETSAIALLLATLPNLGFSMLFTGGGAAIQMISRSSDGSFDESSHLTTLAHEVSIWVWLLPLVTALALLAGAAGVVLYSRSAKEARGGLLRWLAAMTIVSPLLVHFAAVHGHVRGSDFGEEYWANITAGVSAWQSMLLTALWAFVAAVLATGLIPNLFREAAALSYADPLSWPQPQTSHGPAQPPPSH